MKVYHHKVFRKFDSSWSDEVFSVKIDTNINDGYNIHFCYAVSEIELPECELDCERLMSDILSDDLEAKKLEIEKLQEELGHE
jgi:hypothetical protein